MIFRPNLCDAVLLVPKENNRFGMLAGGEEVGQVSYAYDEKRRWTEKQEAKGPTFQLTRYFPGSDIVSSTTERSRASGQPLGLRTERSKSGKGALHISGCSYYERTSVGSCVRWIPTAYLRATLVAVCLADKIRFAGRKDHKTPTERADAQVERATMFRRNLRRITGEDVFKMNTRHMPGAPPVPVVRPG